MRKELIKKFQKINNILEKSKNILIVAHKSPDPDAVGSMMGLYFAFKKVNIKSSVYAAGDLPNYLNFLPGFKKLKEPLRTQNFDLLFCLDYGDFGRLSLPSFLNFKIKRNSNNISDEKDFPVVITVDHHKKGNQKGEIVIIESEISSTSEIIYQFLKKRGIKIDKKIATCLLTGIVGDTVGLSSQYTSSGTLKAVADLVSKDISLKRVNQYLFSNEPLKVLKIWGKAFSRLSSQKDNKFAFSWISQSDLKSYQVQPNQAKRVVNWISSFSRTPFILFLIEYEKGKIRGSLRSKSKESGDMAKIAKALGGGGHRWAAGFIREGTIENTLKKFKNLVG